LPARRVQLPGRCQTADVQNLADGIAFVVEAEDLVSRVAEMKAGGITFPQRCCRRAGGKQILLRIRMAILWNFSKQRDKHRMKRDQDERNLMKRNRLPDGLPGLAGAAALLIAAAAPAADVHVMISAGFYQA